MRKKRFSFYTQNLSIACFTLLSGYLAGQNIGIGTTTPVYKLDVRTSDNTNFARAIYGVNEWTGAGYMLFGIMGELKTTDLNSIGAAVYGLHNSTSGIAAGVWGESGSFSGKGLYGVASSTTGTNYGVYAKTNSIGGYAGYFEGGKNYFQGRVGIGTTTPIYKLQVFDSTSTFSKSVIYAENKYKGSAGTDLKGVLGIVHDTNTSAPGAGVMGYHSATAGGAAGVKGQSLSVAGRGVYGLASSTSGVNFGIYGQTNSSSGYAGYFTGGKNYFQGKVGIGTTSPIYTFHAVDSITVSNLAVVCGENLYQGSSGTLQKGVWGIVRDINTSNPGAGVVGYHAATSGNAAGVKGESLSTTGRGVYGLGISSTGVNYGIYGKTNSSIGYAGYFTGGKNFFDGNVGIGNTNPMYSLDISGGSIRVSNSSSFLVLDGTTTTSGYEGIFFEEQGNEKKSLYYNNASDQMVIYDYNTINYDLTIDNAGKVGIGTLSPTAHMEVAGAGVQSFRINSTVPDDIIFDLLRFNYAGTNYVDWRIINDNALLKVLYSNDDFTTATDGFIFNYLNPDGVYSWFGPTDNGNKGLGASGNRWSAVYAVNGTIQTSDLREKENIADLDYGLAEVLRLHPVTYTWKKWPEQGTRIGLIAQEVEPVLKEVVKLEQNIQQDEHGNVISTGESTYGMSYDQLIPVLIKAIQEQQAQISRLEDRIAELEQD